MGLKGEMGSGSSWDMPRALGIMIEVEQSYSPSKKYFTFVHASRIVTLTC